MINEQRLRARLAALDVAQSLTGFSVSVEEIDTVVPLAEHLEAWLMRPVPTDVVKPDEAPESHLVETTADRPDFVRCPVSWSAVARSPMHYCHRPAEHIDVGIPSHACVCGATLS